MKKISIGLLGFGTVGQAVWKIFADSSELLSERTGLQFEIKKILVRDPQKEREIKVPSKILTTDPSVVLKDPSISIIVELIGGIDPAFSYIKQALENGKHVVTANKALLADKANEIFSLAREKRRLVGFEASVAGGIPILKAIREGFVGNRIQEIYGIINGTSNYILSVMTEKGIDFNTALREAQEKGYAESDPKMDVDGWDAAQKLAILNSLCSGCRPSTQEMYVEGIRAITPFDIQSIKNLGFVVKPLAISKQTAGSLESRVHPTLIPQSHPLADVGGVFNAIYLKGDAVGETMFYGQGAGGPPTASAVISDIVSCARQAEQKIEGVEPPLKEIDYRSIDELRSEYYLRFSVIDRPGVLAEIARILGQNDISISSLYQSERAKGSTVPIVIMTHQAVEANVRKGIETIDKLETVTDKTVLIRVERL